MGKWDLNIAKEEKKAYDYRLTVGFSGSRNVTELTPVDKFYVEKATTVVHGGAVGYDALIDTYAKSLGIKVIVVRPVNPSNKYDYLRRNEEIVDMSDIMHFNWSGKSKGTKFTMEYYVSKKTVKLSGPDCAPIGLCDILHEDEPDRIGTCFGGWE